MASPPRRQILVVNADDYGLTPGVCTGILRAHRDGIVTSTSLLAPAPAFRSHIGALRDSGLDAGIHLCVVGEDPPLLSSSEVPTLVDDAGRFPISWRQFMRRAATGAIDPDDLRREFDAQLEAIRGEGLEPTHVDSHQNLHLWPTVATAAIELAQKARIPVLRVTRSSRRTPVQVGVRTLGTVTAARARRAGLVVPDAATGLDEAGSVDEVTLHSMIRQLDRTTGHADLTVHPGSDPDPDRRRYAWGYSWATELAALCAPTTRTLIQSTRFTLGSFADLARADRAGVGSE